VSTLLIQLAAGAVAIAVGVQDAPEPSDAPADSPTPPSLDDLLGLDGNPDNAAEQAARQNREELERRLSDIRLSDVFVVALEKMHVSAELLDVDLDSGLGTQRVQQDILAKLDQLIGLAKQMSQQQQKSSGSGSSGEPKPQPGAEQQSQPQAGTGQAGGGTQGGQAINPPPGQAGDINTIIEETDTEWGHLPDRLRDMLQQARDSYKSRMYRKLTEEYYKRLAEEGSS